MTPLLPDDVPRLPRGVRLRFDAVRDRHVLLAPERTFALDAIAFAVLELVDGQRTLRDIAVVLSRRFGADPGRILGDVTAMLTDLAGKKVVLR